jgi:hypothetical protein
MVALPLSGNDGWRRARSTATGYFLRTGPRVHRWPGAGAHFGAAFVYDWWAAVLLQQVAESLVCQFLKGLHAVERELMQSLSGLDIE